jgi:hypothetical protein
VLENGKCALGKAASGALVREIARVADRCGLVEITSAGFGYTRSPSAPPCGPVVAPCNQRPAVPSRGTTLWPSGMKNTGVLAPSAASKAPSGLDVEVRVRHGRAQLPGEGVHHYGTAGVQEAGQFLAPA